jgi:hypothetical protein
MAVACSGASTTTPLITFAARFALCFDASGSSPDQDLRLGTRLVEGEHPAEGRKYLKIKDEYAYLPRLRSCERRLMRTRSARASPEKWLCRS